MSSTPSFFRGRLQLGAEGFAYLGRFTAYADIAGIDFKHQVFKERPNTNTGPMYVSLLRLILKNGKSISIKPEDTLRKRVMTHDKAVHDTMINAADWLSSYTFDYRMDGYEADLKAKNYVSWGKHQINSRGELFYRNAFCMSLHDSSVRCMLYPFHMACVRRPHEWLKRVLTSFMRNGETVDLRRDRDCFLYFMRRNLGLSWQSETLRIYRGVPAEGIKEEPRTESQVPPHTQQQNTPHEQPRAQPRHEEQRRQDMPPPPPPPKPKTMPSHVQHLATLGLTPDAPWDKVKTRYRQLVKTHHPDLMRGKGAKEAAIKQAEETLKGLNEAYAWLEDFYKMK